MRDPVNIRKLNELLRSELGANPRYAWRWCEELTHVMEVIQDDGAPVYVEGKSPAGLTVLMPKTVVRKLLPFHENQWILCALVEVNQRDGSLQGTGNHSWVPVSSAVSGPVCLEQHQEPTLANTEAVIQSVRGTRRQSPVEMSVEWEEQRRQKEKATWSRVYDEIRDASTAFANAPGMKGHVSFPSLVTQ